MQEEHVKVKGKNDHIEVVLSHLCDYEQVKEGLFSKLDQLSKFITGSRDKIYLAGRHFTEGQKKELGSIMRREYHIPEVIFCTIDELELVNKKHEPLKEPILKDHKGPSLFKVGHVRGGQILQSQGDITIVGDVNPGAKLVAAGNICVMGALRGNAHAGAFGDGQAVIVANVLEANQLRIADCIGIAPKDNKSGGITEIARILDRRIVIEPLK